MTIGQPVGILIDSKVCLHATLYTPALLTSLFPVVRVVQGVF